MATIVEDKTRPKPISADGYEKFLSVAAIALLGAVAAAVIRGRPEWHAVPWTIWAHLATIIVALVLTPIILLGRRGTPRHRVLGRIWAVSLIVTALISFDIRLSQHGHFSMIHLISVATLILVPRIWWTARHHQTVKHRRAVRGMVTGALLVAGFFTFPFDRLLGHWLFG
ncbi:hypothetical protein BH09PSE4_BH09PSE4_11600 [soil metagenome]